mmetsp:Transcript_30386/g.87014  ORF Transcript_30386/g.87014 Transcript_30386/m.87014 type:complete len:372 (+) Transcript_30386:706-1821(+)
MHGVRAQVAHIRNFLQPDLADGQGRSHGAWLQVVRVGNGRACRGFRHSVALEYGASEDDAEEIQDVVGDGCTARDDDAHAVKAHARLDLREDEAVPKAVLVGARAQSVLFCSVANVEQLFLETAGLLDLRPQPVVDPVQQPRHRGEQSRPQGLQVFEDLHGVPLVEADPRPRIQHADLHAALEHVGERQVGQMHIVLGEFEARGEARGVRDQVQMRQQRALRVPGGARSVAECGDVLRLRRVKRQRLVQPLLHHLCKAEDREASGLGALPQIVRRRLHLHDIFQRRALRLALQQILHNLLAAEHGLQAGLLDDVGDAIDSQGVVGGHRDDGLAEAALLRDDPLRSVLGVEPEDAPPQQLGVLRPGAEVEVH